MKYYFKSLGIVGLIFSFLVFQGNFLFASPHTASDYRKDLADKLEQLYNLEFAHLTEKEATQKYLTLMDQAQDSGAVGNLVSNSFNNYSDEELQTQWNNLTSSVLQKQFEGTQQWNDVRTVQRNKALRTPRAKLVAATQLSLENTKEEVQQTILKTGVKSYLEKTIASARSYSADDGSFWDAYTQDAWRWSGKVALGATVAWFVVALVLAATGNTAVAMFPIIWIFMPVWAFSGPWVYQWIYGSPSVNQQALEELEIFNASK